MNIQVLFFGKLAELSETKLLELNIEENTFEEVLKIIYEKYPLIENENFSIAVNKKIISGEYIFNENDEIALMPPFSGG